jgi:flagellar basal-body rod modification protein FlgD
MTAVNTDPIAAFAARANSANTGGAESAQTRNRLDQNSFLQLMIAQFRNQDPTKPQDPAAFLGQLAQFSTVSGIQDIQASFGTLSDALRGSQVLDGAVLVGHSVLAPGNAAVLSGNARLDGAVEVPEGALTVEVSIKDAAGQLVRRFSAPADAGLAEFAWNGVTDRGDIAGPGTYRVEAVVNRGGANESAQVLLNARVDSVTIDPTTNRLTLNTPNLGAVSLSDVRRVQ